MNYRVWGVPAVLSTRKFQKRSESVFRGLPVFSGKSQPYSGHGPRQRVILRVTLGD